MKDAYKHLNNNDNDNVKVVLNMDELAQIVVDCNYGLNRFLSSVIDIKRKSKYESDQKLADELENILNLGL